METAKIKEMAGECLESQVELLKRMRTVTVKLWISPKKYYHQ